MKANYPKANTSKVEAGKFIFVRKPVTVEAYGEQFTLPVRTVEFCDKLDEITAMIAKSTNTSIGTEFLLDGIALFIGREKTNQLFPSEHFRDLDFDEMLAFWAFLKHEQSRQQRELLAQYR